MPLTILKPDESFSGSLQISNDVATISHTSVHPTLAPAKSEMRVALTWKFDYKDVSREELIEMATKHLVIVERTTFKAIDKPSDNWDGKSFSVRDYLDRERRKPKDKVASIKKLMEGMTVEQKKALLGLE